MVQIRRIRPQRGPGLRVDLPGVAADQHQVAVGVEYRYRRVGPGQTVGVLDVEHRGERRETTDRLDQVVVQVHLEPQHVLGLLGLTVVGSEVTGNRDLVAVRSEQIADVLCRLERVVRNVAAGRITQQRRVGRLADHFHADAGEANVRVADDRAGELVFVLQPDLQHVLALREPRGQASQAVAGRPHAHEVGVRRPFRAGQNQPHAGVHRIGRIEVGIGKRTGASVEPGLHRLRDARQQTRIRLFRERVIAAGHHRAVAVDQFDDRVQPLGRAVDIEPHDRSGFAAEAVDVDVAPVWPGGGLADRPVDFVAQAADVVAALEIRGQFAQELCRRGQAVGVARGCESLLRFVDQIHVAIVAEIIELDAAPIARQRIG